LALILAITFFSACVFTVKGKKNKSNETLKVSENSDIIFDILIYSEFILFLFSFDRNRYKFKPSVKPGKNKFSEYHYMVVSPTDEYDIYYYDKPVIVLIDEDCFSASDIFAAGIRQGDNVKLLGNTSGGGSGFSKRIYLPNTELRVKLSRMFSYQPDGNLYDGHGVVPDIPKDYTFDDKLGLTDSQLERAIIELNK